MSLFFVIAGAAAICSINFGTLRESHPMSNDNFSMNTHSMNASKDTVLESGNDTWWKKEARVNISLHENDIKKAQLRND